MKSVLSVQDEHLQKLMRKVQREMMIQRNCLPTPTMPPILVRRVRGAIVSSDLVSSTSVAKVTYIPYLSLRESNPVFVVLYLSQHMEYKVLC